MSTQPGVFGTSAVDSSKAGRNNQEPQRGWSLSLDSWAVLLAVGLAILVRLGVFKHIPW
ncbi:MAG TPA: hypothetical protein VK525_23150 [Candidatus Saccharimonadales bacterium]|nr:hypothetical protein [Candidatus Saccharimonadales bacterium]